MTVSYGDPAGTVFARIECEEPLARQLTDRLAEIFESGTVAVSAGELSPRRWVVELHFRETPNEVDIRALVALIAGPATAEGLRFDTVAPRDWVAASLAGLSPVAAGRFVVHGAHDRTRVPVNRLGIEIEAALAFGTGHHGTTRGCLVALDRLLKHRLHRRARLLDIGTGSGVLAIAAARALCRPVVAGDIDATAIRVARGNARSNRAGALVRFVVANGVGTAAMRHGGPYDLIMANILLAPLRRMATPLTRLVAPGGTVVLSGLLNAQAGAALASYRARGLVLDARVRCEGWTTLVLRRPTGTAQTNSPRAGGAGR